MANYNTSRRKAEKIMKDRSKKLTAYDFKSNDAVVLIHEDGSFMLYRNAFAETIEAPDHQFTAVYTEHYGAHLFYSDDLYDVRNCELSHPDSMVKKEKATTR